MVKKAYSIETKLACIEMKKAGKSTKVIKDTLNIKNDSQIYTWWKWYQNDELHRLYQPVGKQYTFGKGMEELTEVEQLKLQVKLLKKYHSLTRNSIKQLLLSLLKTIKRLIRFR